MRPVDETPALVGAVAAHELRNRRLVARLRQLGGSPDLPRLVALHFWAPSAEAASRLIEHLVERGLVDLSMLPPRDDQDVWTVQGHLYEPIAKVASSSLTEDVVKLAADLGAEYQGWSPQCDAGDHEALGDPD